MFQWNHTEELTGLKVARLWEVYYKLLKYIPSRYIPIICMGATGRVGSEASENMWPHFGHSLQPIKPLLKFILLLLFFNWHSPHMNVTRLH